MAKLAHIANKSELEPPFLNYLKLNIFKNGVLEGSRLDFGGPRPRFWRVLGAMFRIRHLFLASFPRNGCSQTQCQDCQESRKRRERRNGQKPAKTRTRSQTRQEWVGGGAPPPGGFQSAAHRRWCEACWIHYHIAKKLSALISHKGSIRKAKLLTMGQALDPLSFSLPRRGG